MGKMRLEISQITCKKFTRLELGQNLAYKFGDAL